MACEAYQDQIYLWQRGELEPAAAAAVRAHLEGCQGCREAYAAEEALTAALGRATRHVAPPELRQRVTAALRAAPGRGAGWPAWAAGPRRWRWLVPAAAGAALALLAGVPVTWWMARRPPAPIAVLARAVAHEYERVAYTRTWERALAEPEAALAYLETWLEVAFPKPPAAGGDLRLVGVQPTYFFERRAAAFVYQDPAGRTITLFVFRGGDVQLPERGRVQVDTFKPYFSAADGYTICVWKQKDAGFSMVGKLSREELAQAFLKIRRSL